jgi:hypothetical protein
MQRTTLTEPRRANAPWVTAGALVLVVAALTILLVHIHSVRDDAKPADRNAFAPTSSEQAAVAAAATEAANLTTYTRKSFEADFARATRGATGALRQDLAKQKAQTLSAMTKNKFDLTSKVVESAFESSAGADKVVALVTLNGQHVFDTPSAGSSLASAQRLELTMVRKNGKWLASNLSSVGIQ